MKLVASALVETIVASTMFLIIFMIATIALTRLSAYHSGVDFVQVELDMENSVTLTRKMIKPKQEFRYGWGIVIIEKSESASWPGLYDVAVTAQLKNGHKVKYYYVE